MTSRQNSNNKRNRMFACRRPLCVVVERPHNWDWLKYNLHLKIINGSQNETINWWSLKGSSFRSTNALIYDDCIETALAHIKSIFCGVPINVTFFKFCWNCSNETNEYFVLFFVVVRYFFVVYIGVFNWTFINNMQKNCNRSLFFMIDTQRKCIYKRK